MDIAERIRYFMDKNKIMSVNQLAKITGVNQSNLRSIMLNNQYPRVDTLEKILEPFNVSLQEFFSQESFPRIFDEELDRENKIEKIINKLDGLTENQLDVILYFMRKSVF